MNRWTETTARWTPPGCGRGVCLAVAVERLFERASQQSSGGAGSRPCSPPSCSLDRKFSGIGKETRYSIILEIYVAVGCIISAIQFGLDADLTELAVSTSCCARDELSRGTQARRAAIYLLSHRRSPFHSINSPAGLVAARLSQPTAHRRHRAAVTCFLRWRS